MPFHNFKCSDCGTIFEVFQAVKDLKDTEMCPHCIGVGKKIFSTFQNGSGGLRVFKPMWFEHIAPEPLYIESRKQLKEACEKHECYSQYLEDSYNRRF